ncbi:MAG: hypothetical protein ACRC8F_02010 [Cetobacterium sp.]
MADLQPNEICIVEDVEELIYKDRNGKYISVSKDKYKVDTIEDLKKSKKYKIGDIVEVLGYYSKGDGAGHRRQKVAEGYTGEDAVIGADESIWKVVLSDYIDIRWLGAKNDGTTDISEIINKLNTITDTDKVITQGSYLLNKKIQLAGVWIVNNGATIYIREITSGSAITINSPYTKLKGLGQIEMGWVTSNCISILNAENCCVRDLTIKNVGGTAVVFEGANNLTIEKLRIQYCSNGISNVNNSVTQNKSEGVSILNNEISNVEGSAIFIASKQLGINTPYWLSEENHNIKNIKIFNNSIERVKGHGIINQSIGSIVSGNNILDIGDSIGLQCLVIQGLQSVVISNNIRGFNKENQTKGKGVGIDVGGCRNVVVTNNFVGYVGQIGIEVQCSENVTVSSNTLIDCGILENASGSSCIYIGEDFWDNNYHTKNVCVSSNTTMSSKSSTLYGIYCDRNVSDVALNFNVVAGSATTKEIYIHELARASSFGDISSNLEGRIQYVANETSEFLFSGDVFLTPANGKALKLGTSFQTATAPENFRAEVMIKIKDVNGSEFFIPAKYGSGW